MTDSQFSFLLPIDSEFAGVSDSRFFRGDGKHVEATITDATILSRRSYIEELEKRLADKDAIIADKDAIIDKLQKEVKDQESTIRDCFTELETRNVCDAKTAGPRRDINAGPRPDVSPRNSVQDVPVSATRITHVPRGRVIIIAPENVSCVSHPRQ